MEVVGAEVLELDPLEVGFGLMLGGGSARLVLSLGGEGGSGGKLDEDGMPCELFALFGVVLLIFPIGGRVSPFGAGGGGGMSRLSPFIGGGEALSPSRGG